MFRRIVLFLLVLAGLLALGPSCGGGGGGGGPKKEDITLGLTTQGGATSVDSGGSLVIRANVTNATNMEVTWSMTSSAGAASGGTLTPQSTDFALYEAPQLVLTAFTVTITATSVENSAKTASITLTVNARVVPPNSGRLSGRYAMLLQGFNVSDGGGVAAVGSFLADGYGGISSGSVDYFLGTNLAGATGLSGTYTIGNDDRGTINLSLGATPLTFAVALGRFDGGVAGQASITQTNPATSLPMAMGGSLWRQDPAAFTAAGISGPYAYVLNGWTGTGTREAVGGTVTAAGNGTFSEGWLDDMVFGASPVAGASWTGTCEAPTGAGRTVLAAPALAGTGGTAVLYQVRAGHLVALVYHPGTGRVLSGSLRAQAGPFGQGSLSGTCATLQTANYTQPGYGRMTISILALFTADGAGNLTATSIDQNYGANIGHSQGISYTYTVDTRGRAFIRTGSTLGGMWYLTGPNTALMLGFDAGASVGMILPQTGGPFSAASISGAYFATQAPGGSVYSTLGSGVGTSTGTGGLTETLDLNAAGAITTGKAVPGTVTVGANGVGAHTNGDIIYVISPTQFVTLETDTAYPVIRIFQK